MKKAYLILVALLAGLQVLGQKGEVPYALRPEGDMRAFGSFSLYYTTIAKRNALSFATDGMFFLRKDIAAGITGGVFINQSAPNPKLGSQYYSSFYTAGIYTGLKSAYFIRIYKDVSLSLPLVLGFGGVAYSGDYYFANYYQNSIEANDGFWIVIPGLGMHMNINDYFHMSVNARYRFTNHVALSATNPETGSQIVLAGKTALNGLALGMTFKIGSF